MRENNVHQRFSDKLISLEKTRYNYQDTSISQKEGDFIWNSIRENQYQKTIEIGCALGISSLYICDAASPFSNPSHTIIDPVQTTDWSSIGIHNLQERGVHSYSLIEEPSELALPKLLEQKETFDFGFIDGWHTFDHALLDFFYLNRMIKVGGMIIFDDADWPSISRLLKYLSNYPGYKIILPPGESPKATHHSLVNQLFQLFCYGTKLIPEASRKKIFSDHIISMQFQKTEPSSIVGLMKVAEDKRRWDWYEHFQ